MAPRQEKTPSGPPIVAELGRPETPEETAARKAETSRVHRESQTARNLIAALVMSLGIVVLIMLVVVRPDPAPRAAVDYVAVAAEAQPTVDETLVAPSLPDGWSSNSARLQTSGGVTSWYIGFISPEQQFIGMTQGIDANPTWLAAQLGQSRQAQPVTVEGTTWQTHDNRGMNDVGNLAYVMTTELGNSTIVLFGTASDAEFLTLATSITATATSGN